MDSQITKIISLFVQSIPYDVGNARKLKTNFCYTMVAECQQLSQILIGWDFSSVFHHSAVDIITLWAHVSVRFKTKS